MIPRIEECKSPVRPTRYNLVVAVDIIGSKTAGGIIIPEKTREREDSASDRGRVVAISPMAFKGGDWVDEQNPPKIGDVVLFQKYDGNEIKLDDGDVKYRVITDESVKGVVE